MYQTDDLWSDSEWASVNSVSESRHEHEAQAWGAVQSKQAAEDAHRQWEMFAKVPRQVYTNPSQTRSSLLTQLLNPDANVFPPEHRYRRGSLPLPYVTQRSLR